MPGGSRHLSWAFAAALLMEAALLAGLEVRLIVVTLGLKVAHPVIAPFAALAAPAAVALVVALVVAVIEALVHVSHGGATGPVAPPLILAGAIWMAGDTCCGWSGEPAGTRNPILKLTERSNTIG